VSIELDPTSYDVDELRQLARGLALKESTDAASVEDRPRSRHRSRAPAREVQVESLLRAAAHGEAPRPYLSALPAAYAAEVLADDWCSFLLEQAGFARAYRSLAHYHERGWLGEPALEALQTRVTGLADGVDPRPTGGSLDNEDHRLSLVYVARLAILDGPAHTEDTYTDIQQ
jgi:flagellar protein FlaD